MISERSPKLRKTNKRKQNWDGFDLRRLDKADLVLVVALVVALFLIGIIIDVTRSENKLALEAIKKDKKPISLSGAQKESQIRILSSVLAAQGEGEVRMPILMYHMIKNDLIPGSGLVVPVGDFEEMLKFLKSNGYQTLGLDDLYIALEQGKSLPEKSVILTFDDGYKDNYENAFPLLLKYGFKGTFFVITDYIDRDPARLTSDQLLTMSAAGMDIESHTESHPRLTTVSPGILKRETLLSKKELEIYLGKKVRYFAYPAGYYDENVLWATKEAGYLLAVTTKKGVSQKSSKPYELERNYVGPGTNWDYFRKLLLTNNQ